MDYGYSGRGVGVSSNSEGSTNNSSSRDNLSNGSESGINDTGDSSQNEVNAASTQHTKQVNFDQGQGAVVRRRMQATLERHANAVEVATVLAPGLRFSLRLGTSYGDDDDVCRAPSPALDHFNMTGVTDRNQ